MISQKAFESLPFSHLFPSANSTLDDEWGYNFEYMGGLYQFLDAPGVKFGYGQKTGPRLAFVECVYEGEQEHRDNAGKALKAMDFPFNLGDSFPSLEDAAKHFTELKSRKNPHTGNAELKGFLGDFHGWLTANRAGTLIMIYIHNIKVVKKNDEEGGNIAKQLNSFDY